MLIYLILALICFIVLFYNNNTKGLIVSFVLIAFVACLRGINVGADTSQFCTAYVEIGQTDSWDFAIFRYEAGFFYLCKILNLFSSNYQLLIITTSLIIDISIFFFIKKNSYDYLVSTMIFIFCNCFFSSMNLMRQWLALSIIMPGFSYLIKKDYLKYILLCIIASLFHKVAAVSVLLVFFNFFKKKKVLYIATIAAIVLVFAFADNIFNLLASIFNYENYIGGEFTSGSNIGSLLLLLEQGGIVLILYLLHRKWCKNNGLNLESNLYPTLIDIAVLYFGFLLLSSRMVIFNRFSEFFSVYLLILIPEIFEFLKIENHKNYNMLRFGSLAVFFAGFAVISYFRPEWYKCVPYELCV